MKIVNAETMQSLDKRTIENCAPGAVLMERAGAGAVKCLLQFLNDRIHPNHWQRFAVLAGKGNNGGDAYVIARLLAEECGKAVTVYAVCGRNELKGDSRLQAEKLPQKVDIQVIEELPPEAVSPGICIVDGLLGTGISGPLRPPYDRLISQVNASGCAVMAIDIPSGLDASNGEVATTAIQADLTVTMALPKAGLLTEKGRSYCGLLRCVDIGIPAEYSAEAKGCGEAIFAEDVRRLLTRRPPNSHKGMFGHVGIVAGSFKYTGAPLLTACAALRTGAGLVTMILPESVKPHVPLSYNAMIARAVPDKGLGYFSETGIDVLEEILEQVNCVAFGPGIGLWPDTVHALETILKNEKPVVIDADGLRVVADNPGLLKMNVPMVLTPHPGEMKRLLSSLGLAEYISSDRLMQAQKLAQAYDVYVVLKGQGSVLAGPEKEVAVNTSGSTALATAGTGDVLTGMIASCIAQGMPVWDAMRTAVFVHGYAGELAPTGERALVADDLPGLIGTVFQELSPHA